MRRHGNAALKPFQVVPLAELAGGNLDIKRSEKFPQLMCGRHRKYLCRTQRDRQAAHMWNAYEIERGTRRGRQIRGGDTKVSAKQAAKVCCFLFSASSSSSSVSSAEQTERGPKIISVSIRYEIRECVRLRPQIK